MPIYQDKAHQPFDRFDLVAGAASLLLLLAIAYTVASGDRAGVAVTAKLPQGQAHSTSAVRITFAEPMNTASVESKFSIDPPLAGSFHWNGSQLTFQPKIAFVGGTHYTVTVQVGATSSQGRPLTEAVRWSFDVTAPRVVFLAPAVQGESSAPPNLWAVNPALPFDTTQLTFSKTGLLPDYAVSPDGTRIAFAEKGTGGTADLYLLTLESNTIQRVTQCIDALCQAPDWSPDGTRLVYERVELNSSLPQIDQGVPRAWIVTLADLSTSPLLASSQLLGHAPRWSPDGTQIAVYDKNQRAIILYDLSGGGPKVIPSLDGETGSFDRTGIRFIFPTLIQNQQGFFTTLAVADLAHPQNGIKSLVDKDQTPVEDRQAAWNPDDRHVAVTRKYLDQRSTQGAQVYLVTVETGDAQPLVVDPSYNQGAISWNPTGDQLAMQRYPFFDDNPQPGIWVYEMQTKTLRHIAKNGYLPQWLP